MATVAGYSFPVAVGRIGELTVWGRDRLTAAIGGPARRRAVLILAAVLGLQSADSGAVGALAPQLETAFHIGNTQLGLMVTVTALVGGLASVPMGILTDRVPRVPLLVIAIAVWSGAMVATGLAVSYLMLLLTRLALGVVLAVSGPVVASLTGDLFPSSERARIYGFILTGDLIGAGAGLLVAGDLGAAAGWRLAFFLLAVPSLALAVVVHRLLVEPARGGQSWLSPGATEMTSASGETSPRDDGAPGEVKGVAVPSDSELRPRVRSRGDIRPRTALVLAGNPAKMGFWAAARYVLRIPSNRVLIGSSALGYFFRSGLTTFAVLFARGHFGLSQATVSVMVVAIGGGVIVGTLLGGRIADRLIGSGRLDARLLVAGVCFVVAAVLFAPAFASVTIAVSLPVFIVGGAFFGATNPSLDSARLDVVPSRLWGRAESVRTLARTSLEATAPLLFGFVSSQLAGTTVRSNVDAAHAPVSPAAASGLEDTFLLMLVPLAASGLLLLRSRRAYVRDLATADQSERRSADADHQGGDADSAE